MKRKNHVSFSFDIGRRKPNSIINKNTTCPFCNKDDLEEILDEEHPFILVKNKYNVLENSFQTVVIETDNCDENISHYDKEHMRKLLRFCIKHWEAMENSGEFKSVIFFKNHGPYSGGTIKHSHMQIIGFKDIDYKETLEKEDFEGVLVKGEEGFEVNISKKPKGAMTEFNIILRDKEKIDLMADNIRIIVDYILNGYRIKCESFNLFFYNFDDSIICKIVPRFVASPLFVGFSIMQVSSEIEHTAKELRRFENENYREW